MFSLCKTDFFTCFAFCCCDRTLIKKHLGEAYVIQGSKGRNSREGPGVKAECVLKFCPKPHGGTIPLKVRCCASNFCHYRVGGLHIWLTLELLSLFLNKQFLWVVIMKYFGQLTEYFKHDGSFLFSVIWPRRDHSFLEPSPGQSFSFYSV